MGPHAFPILTALLLSEDWADLWPENLLLKLPSLLGGGGGWMESRHDLMLFLTPHWNRNKFLKWMMVKRVTPVPILLIKTTACASVVPQVGPVYTRICSYSNTQGKFIAMLPNSQRVCLSVRGKITLSCFKTVSILLARCSENVDDSDSGRESGMEESFHWPLTIASD